MTDNPTLFQKALSGTPHACPPVWMMRQAGRYHSHYQTLRKSYNFLEFCKKPKVACEAAMGPIEDFDFDAAILFSDILFPIEAMGIGLDFAPGPQFERLLQSPGDLRHYTPPSDFKGFMGFQAEALALTRKALSDSKSLLGFVGGPATLYLFAVEGSAKKDDFSSSERGYEDGRFEGLMQKLIPMLVDNMVLQSEAGADCVAVFDSSAGRVGEKYFASKYLPYLKQLLEGFRQKCPDTPLLYYGKGIGPPEWELLKALPISLLGIDYDQNLETALTNWTSDFSIQGNLHPDVMTWEEGEAEKAIREHFQRIKTLPESVCNKWVAGLGHGLTPQAKEANVRSFIKILREIFS